MKQDTNYKKFNLNSNSNQLHWLFFKNVKDSLTTNTDILTAGEAYTKKRFDFGIYVS